MYDCKKRLSLEVMWLLYSKAQHKWFHVGKVRVKIVQRLAYNNERFWVIPSVSHKQVEAAIAGIQCQNQICSSMNIHITFLFRFAMPKGSFLFYAVKVGLFFSL